MRKAADSDSLETFLSMDSKFEVVLRNAHCVVILHPKVSHGIREWSGCQLPCIPGNTDDPYGATDVSDSDYDVLLGPRLPGSDDLMV